MSTSILPPQPYATTKKKKKSVWGKVAPLCTSSHLLFIWGEEINSVYLLSTSKYSPVILVTRGFKRESGGGGKAANRTKGLEGSGSHHHLGFLNVLRAPGF